MAWRDDQAFIDRDERMFQDEERKIKEDRFLPMEYQFTPVNELDNVEVHPENCECDMCSDKKKGESDASKTE